AGGPGGVRSGGRAPSRDGYGCSLNRRNRHRAWPALVTSAPTPATCHHVSPLAHARGTATVEATAPREADTSQ
ncbi:hypothetical protein ACIQOV_28645, partial [Kitasatospora sp. NPDC091257]|uniref:hypothetical protein n=1 Tax=Kitasatospora sp. NPDC091257 TaxID=3364084 RepID=UPI003812A6D7